MEAKQVGFKFLEHLTSWVGMLGTLYFLFDMVFMPKVTDQVGSMITAQSHKEQYLDNNRWCGVYKRMEENGETLDARQKREKSVHCKKEQLYLTLMVADYEAGLIDIDDLDIQ